MEARAIILVGRVRVCRHIGTRPICDFGPNPPSSSDQLGINFEIASAFSRKITRLIDPSPLQSANLTADSSAAPLDLQLFDGVRLLEGVEIVRSKATQKRRLAILAYLALAPNRTASRETIMAMLWAEHSPDNARRLMAESVYQIRKELGADVLRVDGDVLTLQSRVTVDVDRFVAAEEGGDLPSLLQFYQGPLFGTWSVGDATEYEQWAEARRADFSRRFCSMVQQSAVAAIEGGDYGKARSLFARLRVEDPDSVSALEGEARALCLSGEPLQAVRLIDEFAERWKGEFSGALPRSLVELRGDIEGGRIVPRNGAASAAPLAHGAAAAPAVPARAEATSAVSEASAASDVPAVAAAPTSGVHAAPADLRVSPVPPATLPARRRTRFGWPAVVAVLISATALLWKRETRGSLPAAAPATRVAVIPASAVAEDTSLAYLRDALLTDITDQLSVNAFPVAALSEVRAVESGRITLDSLVNLRRIGTLVELALEGRETDLRMTVRLLDAATRGELAMKRFSRPRSEALALEDDAVRFAADVLGRRMGQAIILRDTMQFNRDAYARKLLVAAVRAREDVESVTRNVQRVDRSAAINALRSADSLLVRALQQESDWPALMVERARIRLVLSRFVNDGEALAMLDTGVTFASNALRYSADDPSALIVRGQLLFTAAHHEAAATRDTARDRRAAEDLRRATAIAPYRADAWMTLHHLQTLRGQYEMARTSARRAFENDAFMYDSERAYFALFAAAIGTQDVEEAYRWCDQGRLAHPGNTTFIVCEITLMRERPHRVSDVPRARTLVPLLDSLLSTPRSGVNDSYLPIYVRVVTAGVVARSGDTASARRELEAARAMLPPGQRKARQSFAFDEGWVQLQLGDTIRAVEVLSQLAREDIAMHERLVSVPMYKHIRTQLPPLEAAAGTEGATATSSSAPPTTP